MSVKASTPEAARMLGVEPRVLRKYLRNHADDWPGVGQGGRYYFSQGDIHELARRMGIDMKKKYEDRKGFTIEQVVRSHQDEALRKAIIAERRARQRRLEQAMRSAGVWGHQSRKGVTRVTSGNFV